MKLTDVKSQVWTVEWELSIPIKRFASKFLQDYQLQQLTEKASSYNRWNLALVATKIRILDQANRYITFVFLTLMTV